jgi:hypothetical protein
MVNVNRTTFATIGFSSTVVFSGAVVTWLFMRSIADGSGEVLALWFHLIITVITSVCYACAMGLTLYKQSHTLRQRIFVVIYFLLGLCVVGGGILAVLVILWKTSSVQTLATVTPLTVYLWFSISAAFISLLLCLINHDFSLDRSTAKGVGR